MIQSQHYAGVAFDVGQTLSGAQRNRVCNSAVSSGIWSYVEPKSQTPTWVHFDKRFGRPACSTGGLDGIFGAATQSEVISYQRSRGLTADGIVGCNTWRALQENVVGTGPTSTTIN